MPLQYGNRYWCLIGEIFFVRLRERDFDLAGRGDCVVSMSSLRSDERETYLFDVSMFLEFSLINSWLFWVFVCDFGWACFFCFRGELLRTLFLLKLELLVVAVSCFPEPVDVWTDGRKEASRRDGCGPIQNARVWQSTAAFFVADLAALADDVVTDGEDGGTTSFLASPYERDFSVLTRWISCSWIQTGHHFEEAKWSPLQLRQQTVSDVQSPPSWPSLPHFQQASWFLHHFLEWPNFWHWKHLSGFGIRLDVHYVITNFDLSCWNVHVECKE